MKGFPTSYKDPVYDDLDAATEQKLGLPAGMLSSIRTVGEKSNADQVSSAGARTPYQFTPSTRKLILKKYGIDPYLSPDNASEAAGLLLKESLDRNDGDIETAVGEYHGGTSRKNWGPVNSAYRKRVVAAIDNKKVEGLSNEFAAWAAENPAEPEAGTLEADFAAWNAKQAPEREPQVPKSALDENLEAVPDVARAGLRGGTLGLSDPLGAAIAAVPAAIGSEATLGEAYTDIREAQNVQRDIFRAQNPALAYGSELAGTIPVAIVTGGMVNPALTVGGRVLQGGVIGAAQSGIYSAAQAAPGQELKEGAKGLVIGTALGGMFPLALGSKAAPVAAAADDVLDDVTRGARAAADVVDTPVAQQADDVAMAAARGAADDVAMAADDVAVQAADDAALAAATSTADDAIPAEQFGELARKAAAGSQSAKEELARNAAVNPVAKEAADSLGIDLPVDVISDSRLLKETVGLSRSLQGTEQSQAWYATKVAASQKADEVLQAMDASTDIAAVSEAVKSNLGKLQRDLGNEARQIYDQVDSVIPKKSAVNMPKTVATIDDIVAEVGEQNLSAAEKRLFELATNPNTTYGALLREKSQIGAALERSNTANPYGSVETGTLKRLYGALADDQLSAVESVAGKEARDNLRYANQLTAKKKALERRIVQGFGKEGEGSIATKITSAIKSGAKGDITGLNKVIKTVPKDMRRETLASGIMSAARTPQGNFSFQQYAKLYDGMRKNTPIYSAIAKEFEPQQLEAMRSLYVVSKRIADAENLVLKTGKANQALVQGLQAENLVEKIMGSAAGKYVAAGVSRGTAGTVSPDTIVGALVKTPDEKIMAAGKLFTSSEFEQLIKAGAAGEGVEEAATRLAKSSVFSKFADSVKLPKELAERKAFILSSMQAGKVQAENGKGTF